MNYIKSLKLNTIEAKIDRRGFVYCKFDRNAFKGELTVDQFRRFIESVDVLCADRAYPFLIDMRDVETGQMDVETGRLFAKSPELNAVRLTEAFVVNSLSTQVMINFYLQAYRPPCPSRVFTDLEEAIDYCIGFTSR